MEHRTLSAYYQTIKPIIPYKTNPQCLNYNTTTFDIQQSLPGLDALTHGINSAAAASSTHICVTKSAND